MPEIQDQKDTGERDETTRLLQILRTQVHRLTEEVQKLRRENEVATKRLRDLEQQVDHEGTLLSFDDDPEKLRKEISAYIKTIDQHLGQRGDN